MRRGMTPAEKQLWQKLRRSALGFHFRRQQIIDGFIVDFYCHAAGVVVEVDDPVHHTQTDYDENRDAALAKRGLHILRIKNEDVRLRLKETLDLIAAVCQERMET